MQGTIRVTPQQLISTSQEFSSKGSQVSNLTNEMTSKVNALSSVWEGEAATAYTNKFKGLEDDIQKLVRMIKEHSDDLQQMATEYQQANSTIMDEISSLKSDVIN